MILLDSLSPKVDAVCKSVQVVLEHSVPSHCAGLIITHLFAIFELAVNSGSDIESVDNWKPLSDHCHTGSDWDQSTGSYELNRCHKQGTKENDVEGSGGHAGEDSYAIALDGE